MKTLKSLPILRAELTTKEKLEYLLIAVCGIIFAAVGIMTFTPAFADGMTSTDLADLVRLIVKIICLIVGALFSIVGIVKFAISHANEDGPAQQKAIMMIATGILLVVLGLALPEIIQDSWFEVEA